MVFFALVALIHFAADGLISQTSVIIITKKTFWKSIGKRSLQRPEMLSLIIMQFKFHLKWGKSSSAQFT